MKTSKRFKEGDQVRLINKVNSYKMIVTYTLEVQNDAFENIQHVECMWFEEHKPLQKGVFKSTELEYFNTSLEG